MRRFACLAALLSLGPARADAPAEAHAPPPLDEARVHRGAAVYERYCLSCHGPDGDGRGYSAPWIDPMPRDFTKGAFKWRSTPSGSLPTDDDLLRTVTQGLFHTNMPSWGVLGERDLRAVLEYIKTFSPRWKEEAPGPSLVIPPEPADDAESRQKGAEVWAQMGCANCHGPGGKGDGPSAPTLVDDWGNKIVPHDFTRGQTLKCGKRPQDLYRVFMTGLNGTPMPSFGGSMSPQEAWALVHFVRTLVRER